MTTIPLRARQFDRLLGSLSLLAVDLDRCADEVERLEPSYGEGALLWLPLAHLAIGTDRIEQAVHAAHALVQRGRLSRAA